MKTQLRYKANMKKRKNFHNRDCFHCRGRCLQWINRVKEFQRDLQWWVKITSWTPFSIDSHLGKRSNVTLTLGLKRVKKIKKIIKVSWQCQWVCNSIGGQRSTIGHWHLRICIVCRHLQKMRTRRKGWIRKTWNWCITVWMLHCCISRVQSLEECRRRMWRIFRSRAAICQWIRIQARDWKRTWSCLRKIRWDCKKRKLQEKTAKNEVSGI
jgi:hypothetical protein